MITHLFKLFIYSGKLLMSEVLPQETVIKANLGYVKKQFCIF